MELRDVKWRLVYDSLWLRFNAREFKFEDALEIIFDKKTFGSKEIKYASKLLNEIEDNAYAIHTRASYDQRVMLYRILHPEKVGNARAICKTLYDKDKAFSYTDLAKEANKLKKWNYMYIKDSAIGFWTNHYRSVDVYHLSIEEKDLDGWIALFKLGEDRPILVDDKVVYESKANAKPIHLHTDLTSREDQVTEMTNLHYQPPHYTIAECLEDKDVLGALAVMIRCRDTLRWDRVIDVAKDKRVINTLGFCMDTINKEADRKVFDTELIERVMKLIEKRAETIGKTPELGTAEYASFRPLEEKWNVKCYQANAFTKAVDDLIG